ncbi:serine/arginine repetitive matrix protein 2 [Kryptolebias marmoratus]|uniref:serine/arginine repetitive matrix protein 2 n=1 Tax=Kryptolebias marmoratus TaxID=37003 RepID=UPI0018ACC7CA|nr:serine/arginine repetitive matrix protein 2 [Kryptolebias marmoratus]
MPLSSDEPMCPKFQPNIFDPSRCHDCLRQRHLHTSSGESPEAAPGQKPPPEPEAGTKAGTDAGAGSGIGSGRGVFPLTPIPSQAEERDASSSSSSSKEDSDGVSVVSSYCDVNGGRAGYDETSLCILSPDCELYICDGDDDYSTDSCRDQSEGLSSSVSAEEEYLPSQRRPTKFSMTRLDPPPHRPNPRAWLEDTRGSSSFTGRSGLKEDREKRESGYYSLGRAAGARSLSEKSPPGPFRHFEKGHPIFNSRNVEPKDVIPFRNPNLGVASERLIPEVYDEDLAAEIPPPDPYDVAVEVEAQVGPRSPSPTPFKIAESLASSGRKGSGRGSPSSHFSSHQQSGRYDSSRHSSALQSRSSSPSRGNFQLRRSESSGLLSGQNFNGGGWSRGTAPGSRSSLQSTHGRHFESGTLPRNFKSLASSVKSQSSAVSDFRSALRKTEASSSSCARSSDIRSSSPQRRDRSSSALMSRNSEGATSLSQGPGSSSRASSPSRRPSDRVGDSHTSSLPSRNFSAFSRPSLRKSGSVMSLNEHGHHGRSGSPVREGYGIESQAQLRNQLSRNEQNSREQEHGEDPNVSPFRQGPDRSRPSILRKTESTTVSSNQSWNSRSSSPERRGHETINQHQLGKRDLSVGSLNGHGYEKRNSSPSRRNDAPSQYPSQSLLHKSEFTSSVRSHDSYRSSALRKAYDAPDQVTKTGVSLNHKNQNRSFSPSQKGNSDPPGYSVLRSATNGDSTHSFQRKVATNETKSDSWRGSTHSLRSSSLSRSTSRKTPDSNRAANFTLDTTRTSGSVRSAHGRHGREGHCPPPKDKRSSHRAQSPSTPPQFDKRPSHRPRSPSPPPQFDKRPSHRPRSPSPPPQIDKRSSHRAWSPSPPPQIHIQSHTSSQSSMESSESGRILVGSTGRNKEEYATMADLPKVKRIHQGEEPGHTGRPQNSQPVRRQELFKPASHSLSRHPSTEWDDTWDTEREWHYGGSGYLSRAQSTTSLQRSGSPTDEGSSWKSNHHRSEQMQVGATAARMLKVNLCDYVEQPPICRTI